MQIYSSKKIDGTWQEIEKLPFNDDEHNTVHPSISVEGDALYFFFRSPRRIRRNGYLGGIQIRWRMVRTRKSRCTG